MRVFSKRFCFRFSFQLTRGGVAHSYVFSLPNQHYFTFSNSSRHYCFKRVQFIFTDCFHQLVEKHISEFVTVTDLFI